MKKYEVLVSFMAGCTDRALYTKYYIVKARSEEEADAAAYNGLSMIEFHNFKILEIKECEK